MAGLVEEPCPSGQTESSGMQEYGRDGKVSSYRMPSSISFKVKGSIRSWESRRESL